MVPPGVVSSSQKTVALVTSGLGTAYGGIGVVAKAIQAALEPDCKVLVWQHPPFWPRPLRIGKIAAHVLLGSRRRPDLVIYDHVHLAVLHAMVPRFRSVPYAVFIHGVEVWQPLGGRRRETLLGASAIVANSATTVLATRRANPWLPKAEVAWLGIRGSSRRVDPGQLPPNCLIVGRMSSPERYKGHDAVMNAWPLIRAAVPNAQLTIIGTGSDEPRLRRRVEEEHLSGIRFLGRVSDEERDRLYCSSRLLFYPSEQEGFGLAGIEAASFGVPFMGLAGTVTAELFPDSDAVVLAKDLAPESIARSAIPVLTDSNLATRVGERARHRVQSTFLEEHFAARFRRAISKVLPFADQPDRSAESSAVASDRLRRKRQAAQ
jgi:phosphatidylinositol alpha-1,6-mannosyltransferase